MAVIDNFETYSTGNLNGQGGWSGSSSFDVQTTTVQNGSKSVKGTTTGTWIYIEKQFLSSAAGTQTVYCLATTTAGWGPIVYLKNTTGDIVVYVKFYFGGPKWVWQPAGADQDIVGASLSTWYKVEIEWTSGNQVRARINDGTWESWAAGIAPFSEIGTVGLQCQRTSHFDNMSGTQSAGFTPKTSFFM